MDQQGKDEGRDRGQVFPVVEEQLEVEKRQRETGRVRVTRSVQEQIRHVEETLTDEEVEVRRVSRGEVVSEAPAVRQEGDTMIIPVLEEEIVVQRRLVLREEVHVTRRQRERHYVDDIPLRTESVTVERSNRSRSGEAREPGTDAPE